MKVPVTMPDLGVPAATLSTWFIDVGSPIDEGELLLEVLTKAATFSLSAPTSGRLVEHCLAPRDRVLPGQVLGYIEDIDPNS